MSKHTPGPWTEEVNTIVTKTDENYRNINAGRGYLHPDDKTGFCLTGYMSPADARLIAAAPDLFEALTVMVSHYGPTPSDEIDGLGEARAAIAKAKGEVDENASPETSVIVLRNDIEEYLESGESEKLRKDAARWQALKQCEGELHWSCWEDTGAKIHMHAHSNDFGGLDQAMDYWIAKLKREGIL